ncbi:MAG: adenosylcobinamide-GDP ribazoletransferase [Microcystis aeruginosa K13-05]|uniref:adenosylcobinamide-GDP ribazoletransferase n=1 Tax=unclassified Microcystis TaxID=2643300 RepID=UPI0022BFAB8A|nr:MULTISPECIES: adenosylcobinamide-GDP ribazoletransferase [unclassified Microcystis]MCZ8046115.1 adenosylcobinamide-GDP ribazoletransferase [Microcystis sp. LE19-41.2A]MCZ8287470.1 adenosylcobinamide-GDP ribazoletransferase [Microcystis sp. LE19-59.1C]NCR78560.1 adenosylcobinamide-GDP ribazoletransferase [Microcystis aeruginosa K13-10]NCR83287.1 adenosylcobinamide-GDP ribazoletransferase [Microcystis aeruginosa K13-05]
MGGLTTIFNFICQEIRSFLGAIAFYTIIPVPIAWPDFGRIARWIALVGLFLGLILVLLDITLAGLGMPPLTRAVVLVGVWVYLTGGLHLDGVSDTADGLAVTDPQRRLLVMADSVTGAFGVMAVTMVLLLKIAALTDLSDNRALALILAPIWGRWGQVMAIALYPYLKPTGKGAFHKVAFCLPWDCGGVIWGLIALFGGLRWGIIAISAGIALALLTGYWLYRRLRGHTGDTYGAVVEWTEALFLVFLTIIS